MRASVNRVFYALNLKDNIKVKEMYYDQKRTPTIEHKSTTNQKTD